MTEEIIEHTVEVDEYISAIIKIPKTLTAIDLKALMFKANKLFNIAEVPLIDKPKRKYMKKDETLKLIEKYDKANDKEKQEMANEFGVNLKSLYQRIWKSKKNYGVGVPTTARKGGKKKYSDELLNKIIKGLKKGKTIGQVAEEVGMHIRVAYDLVYSRTGKRPSSFQKG